MTHDVDSVVTIRLDRLPPHSLSSEHGGRPGDGGADRENDPRRVLSGALPVIGPSDDRYEVFIAGKRQGVKESPTLGYDEQGGPLRPRDPWVWGQVHQHQQAPIQIRRCG